MATHGRTGLARIVMGSVTDKIVRGSHVPVLTLLPPAHDTHSH
jgi:nucleotide-binding universal stress UspA family protein